MSIDKNRVPKCKGLNPKGFKCKIRAPLDPCEHTHF